MHCTFFFLFKMCLCVYMDPLLVLICHNIHLSITKVAEKVCVCVCVYVDHLLNSINKLRMSNLKDLPYHMQLGVFSISVCIPTLASPNNRTVRSFQSVSELLIN